MDKIAGVNFSTLTQPTFDASGIYYKLETLDQPYKARILRGIPIYLPVSDNSNPVVSYGFRHTYNESDTSTKKLMGGLSNLDGYYGLGKAFAEGSIREISAQSQAAGYGGGIYLSGSSMYLESSPNNFTISTTIFSMGSEAILAMIENLRYETSCSLLPSVGAASITGVGMVSVMNMPPWWRVSVVMGKDGKIISTMEDMQCVEMGVVMRAPFYENGTASVYTITMTFVGAFRGHAESAKFGI